MRSPSARRTDLPSANGATRERPGAIEFPTSSDSRCGDRPKTWQDMAETSLFKEQWRRQGGRKRHRYSH